MPLKYGKHIWRFHRASRTSFRGGLPHLTDNGLGPCVLKQFMSDSRNPCAPKALSNPLGLVPAETLSTENVHLTRTQKQCEQPLLRTRSRCAQHHIPCIIYLYPVLLSQGRFGPQGSSGNVWWHFWWSQLQQGGVGGGQRHCSTSSKTRSSPHPNQPARNVNADQHRQDCGEKWQGWEILL